MKALRMSPISRRQESGSCGGPSAILHALHRRLCLELELCVAASPRGLCTEAAERALQWRQESRSASPTAERDVAAAVVLALSALPTTEVSRTCGCVRLAEWLGNTSAGSTFECQFCENIFWSNCVRSPAARNYDHSTTNAPSLLMVRTLLGRGAFSEAAELARVLLRAGANPDETDREGRSLLSYSVQQLDDCIVLTRLLLNNGASVWHGTPNLPQDPDHSAFTWLLRAIIIRRRFEHCSLTLEVLARVMGNEPIRMKALVLRTMYRHARSPRVLGPIFQQIKFALSGYWNQPQCLQYSCWRAVRRALRPSNVLTATPRLGLPVSLQNYLIMEDTDAMLLN